jgi:hypothetical protein
MSKTSAKCDASVYLRPRPNYSIRADIYRPNGVIGSRINFTLVTSGATVSGGEVINGELFGRTGPWEGSVLAGDHVVLYATSTPPISTPSGAEVAQIRLWNILWADITSHDPDIDAIALDISGGFNFNSGSGKWAKEYVITGIICGFYKSASSISFSEIIPYGPDSVLGGRLPQPKPLPAPPTS